MLKFLQKKMTLLAVFVLPFMAGQADAATQPISISRDSYGVPTISGGDFAEICRALGQVHSQDRLWQLFLTDAAANGRLSELFGAGTGDSNLESDILARTINPTDQEVEEEIAKYFNKNTLTALTNYVKGLNDTVDQVNSNPALLPFEFAVLGFSPANPIPHFTLNDILRTERAVLQQFSFTQIPEYQIDNLVSLLTLSAIFGQTEATFMFNDIVPTSTSVKSDVTMKPNNNCGHFKPCDSERSVAKNEPQKQGLDRLSKKEQKKTKAYLASLKPHEEALRATSAKLKRIKEVRRKYMPGLGSNGQAVGPCKTKNGTTLLRGAPQPNFNQPSDFYQVRVNSSVFTMNGFTFAGFPYAIGVFNNTMGFTVQVGHLPTNDFLIESTDNICTSRQETLYILNTETGQEEPYTFTIQRSKSCGWVIQNPFNSTPGTMLTLRSAFIHKQLRGLNFLGDLPFVKSVPDLFDLFANPANNSDIIGLEGQAADSLGNIGIFQPTAWTELPIQYDRRIPQGIPGNDAAPNSLYCSGKSTRAPLFDMNTSQGYYTGWNNLFKQFAAGNADTVTGIPLSRAYWLNDFLRPLKKITFDDLKYLTVRQAVANSIVAFNNTTPDQYADYFVPYFKKRFLGVLQSLPSPTPDQAAALSLLTSFDGSWFDGDEAQIIATNDVSDKFILASAWLLNFAADILNPYFFATQFEVNAGSPGNPLPTFNDYTQSNGNPVYNDLHLQANLLGRILGAACDNSLTFPFWLQGVDVDAVILASLDQALTNLGGFAARPWGLNKRPDYAFINPVVSQFIGPIAVMKNFNASGLYFIAEFSCKGLQRMESVIPLGESGLFLVDPITHGPVFTPHLLDQQPLYTTFQLIPQPINQTPSP